MIATEEKTKSITERIDQVREWLLANDGLTPKSVSLSELTAKLNFDREHYDTFRETFAGCCQRGAKAKRRRSDYGPSTYLIVEENGITFECDEPKQPDVEDVVL